MPGWPAYGCTCMHLCAHIQKCTYIHTFYVPQTPLYYFKITIWAPNFKALLLWKRKLDSSGFSDSSVKCLLASFILTSVLQLDASYESIYKGAFNNHLPRKCPAQSSNFQYKIKLEIRLWISLVSQKNRLGMKMKFCSLFCVTVFILGFVPLMLSSLFKLNEERGNTWKAQFI